jgi:hypothetical protein
MKKHIKKKHMNKTLFGDDPDIIRAIRYNDIEEVKALLNRNPREIFTLGPTGMNGLHYSGGLGKLEIAELLFETPGSDEIREQKDYYGREPMRLALESGNEEIKELFFRKIFPEVYENPENPYGGKPGGKSKAAADIVPIRKKKDGPKSSGP